ncbi:MAG: AMP-binding protein [Anaerolineae bacterium]|nr:MAG: AMP-binding protein [Anaerolineae bacterium]
MHATIYELLKAQAERRPESVAILTPDRAPLTYRRLHEHVQSVVAQLNALGVGRNDRVAIVLPNGPSMAVAFLSVAATATSAPLNPAYRAAEFDFYLSDLEARALVVVAGMDSPAVEVARSRGVPVIKLAPLADDAAGLFTLSGGEIAPSSQPYPPEGGLAAPAGFAQSGDVALVLHTSGTTSRPKMVPLRHGNLCASADNIRRTLRLTPNDRCLNVMPLFHIHGLMAATLSSLAAGGSVVCTPGFDAARFFDWLAAHGPTWYTAVPTMHQAVLARAAEHRQVVAQTPLRFIRSSSSSLPPQVMAELEGTFGVPVIESYGMTEASHQMASNPLPPQPRKPGSVGLAAGPEVAIMAEEGAELLPAGQVGEIVIRGPNVTLGYASNPEANAKAFTNGWFRTGDQGYMDDDGYFYITGRLKEIVNRGGEKIAPREVDEALLGHPAVVQAIAFAVPHATLGEDLAAAVVLQGDASTTEREIREFAFARLADHKVPSQVLIVDKIPKGPTGKLQRIGLADKLADELKAEFVAPRNPAEELLVKTWAEVLGVEQVGVHDNFFTLGGDSLRVAQLVSRLRTAFQAELPLTAIFQRPTVEELAGLLRREERSLPWSSLVAIQPGGSKQPFFCVPGNLGNVFTDLGDLARYLGPDQPFYGLQDGAENPSQIEALAAHYLDEIRTVQPAGPYLLGGICSGGVVVFEMAQQLRAQREKVALLALIEPTPPTVPGLRASVDFLVSVLRRSVKRFGQQSRSFLASGSAERETYARLKAKVVANMWALTRYRPQAYPGRMVLFVADESLHKPARRSPLGWRELVSGGAEVLVVPGTHDTITRTHGAAPRASDEQILADKLSACLDAAQ